MTGCYSHLNDYNAAKNLQEMGHLLYYIGWLIFMCRYRRMIFN